MQYILETQSLCKHYKNNKALHDLNMHVPKGAIYGFVGKNGAGKTTLIRLITGLQRPTFGNYRIFGAKNTDKAILRARKRMGAVVESPSLYMNMTARENMIQQFILLGLTRYDEIDELLKFVGISNTGKKKVKDFSLGMRQRLGIAVALAGSPDLLVLDEPINGLDPQGIVDIRELVLKLNREKGVTVLISSHILDELSRIATHYGFIDRGHIIHEMSAKELEASCRKRISVRVSDARAMVRALDAMKLRYEVVSNTDLHIFDEASVSELSEAAKAEGCCILAMNEQNESLESFYMNLIGGGRHA